MIDAGAAAWLMTRDAENLDRTSADGKVRVEVYRFEPPSVTAGRNARVEDAELRRWMDLGHDFARRPTGGGILRHGGDICFGLCFPGEGGSRDFLRAASAMVKEALHRQGIHVDPEAVPNADRAPEFCFARAVGCELLYLGEKLLGLAARRVRGATLVQGSLAVERQPAIDREVIGEGPRVSLEGTGFRPADFAAEFRSMVGENVEGGCVREMKVFPRSGLDYPESHGWLSG